MKKLLLATAALPVLFTAAHAQEVDGGEILVTGQRAQQERAIEIKRNAIGIIDVAAADEIGRLPDRNVAEVIERLPGVGVTYDQGEGRFVAIRGIPSDLNGYTFGGVEIGNPDGQTRSLPLDIVSGQLLNRVEVVKAKTADQDGQGIGGSINLVPQTAFDFADRFVLQANAQVGYQELNDKVPVRGDISVGGRFGANEEFGILIGGSYSERTFTSYGVYPDDWRPPEGASTPAAAAKIAQSARGAMPTNIKHTDYSLKRERIGVAGSLDWRPSDDHEIYLRGIYSKFTEDEYRQRYRLDFATDALLSSLTFNPGGLSGIQTGNTERRQDLRLEYKEKSILAGMLGGSSRFGDLKLDYVVARVHNEVREPNQLWQFRCNPGTVDFDFSEKIFSATPRTECTPAQMGFRQYSEQVETGDEDIWQGKADLTWNIAAMDEGSFVKAGGKYRATDKSFDSSNETWMRGGTGNRFTLGQFDLQGADARTYPDGDDRLYLNSPTIDAGKIIDFTNANLSGPLFVRDPAASLANATLNDIFIEENVWAAYAMASLKFGPVTVTPGLRYEHTTSNVRGSRLENGAVVPIDARNTYQDWLPSVVVRIDAGDKYSFRLAYTRNLGRPNYGQLSPGGELEYADGNGNGTFEGSFSEGNPNLKPYRANSLDVSAEYYFARGSLISLGGFVKFIENPIYIQNFEFTDTTFAGINFERLGYSQPRNAKSATLTGVEAAFQQQFTFLPGFLSGFGVELNGTLVGSTLTLQDGRSSSFPSQSKFLYGAQLFYQGGPIEASIAYHNTGASLIAVGGEPFQDQYNDDLRRLDAKVRFQITGNVAVFGEAQNLTDEPTRQYQGNRTDWFTQQERYGRTFWAGVSAKF